MNRTILVTGGSGRIGRILIAHFLRAGDCVITNSRSNEAVEVMHKMHSMYSQNFFALRADLTAEQAPKNLIDLYVMPRLLLIRRAQLHPEQTR